MSGIELNQTLVKLIVLFHFYIFEEAHFHHFTPPKIQLVCPTKFGVTSVFNLSWIFQWSQEKLKTILMKFLRGKQGVLWDYDSRVGCSTREAGVAWYHG